MTNNPTTATTTTGPLDKTALERLERLGGTELMVRVIDQFLDKMPLRMDAACDRGRAGDLGALGSVVQSIKSAAGNVGAVEVRDMADRIERLAVQGAKDLIVSLPPSRAGAIRTPER